MNEELTPDNPTAPEEPTPEEIDYGYIPEMTGIRYGIQVTIETLGVKYTYGYAQDEDPVRIAKMVENTIRRTPLDIKWVMRDGVERPS